MMLRIVGLSNDTMFYQVKVHGMWKQFTKPIIEFIHMMNVLCPDVMKQAKPYHFEDSKQVANWLYNYGESVKPCETYIFYIKSK